MKHRIVILIVALCFSNKLLAQVPKYYFGGDVGFNYSSLSHNETSINDNYYFMFNLNPIIGFYIIDNFVGGAGFQIYNSKSNSSNSVISIESSKEVYFTPFFKYYLKSGFFGQVQFNLGSIHSEVSYNDKYVVSTVPRESKRDISAAGLGFGLGYAIKAGGNFKIEPFIKYRYIKYTYDRSDYETKSNGITFNIGISYSL